MLKQWHIQNPRSQLSLNMYISYSGFHFFAHTAQSTALKRPYSANMKNTIFCVSRSLSTDVTVSPYTNSSLKYKRIAFPFFYCMIHFSSYGQQLQTRKQLHVVLYLFYPLLSIEHLICTTILFTLHSYPCPHSISSVGCNAVCSLVCCKIY